MFGIGFPEFILIAIVAILFLGPDKLPQAMVEVAKFIKSIKQTVGDAKSSIEEEMKIADLKEEAAKYKQQLDNATNELKSFKNIDFDDMEDLTYDEEISKKEPSASIPKPSPYADENKPQPQIEQKNDTVTFEKKQNKNDETEKSTKDGES